LHEVVLQNRVYAPSPTSFNDPLDCRVRIPPSTDPKEWRQLFEKSLRKLKPDLKSEALRKEVTRSLAKGLWKLPETLADIISDLQVDVDHTGVVCLCESGTTPLMWSHYASGHHGFCLRLRTLQNSIFYETERVKCSLEYPLPPFSAEPDEQVAAFLLTKAIWWEYEREWRFIGYRNGPGHRLFPPDALDAVILGCRTSPETRKIVLNMVAARPRPVPVLQAALGKETFDLELVPAS